MKKFMILILTFVMVLGGSFCAFAGCRWDTDNYGIKATWDQLVSKGTIYLYKGSLYKVGNKVTVSKDTTSHDFTQRIQDMGPGTYHFTITDTSGKTWTSEDLQVDETMIEYMGKLTWCKEDGYWKLRNFKGEILTGWQQVDGKWYYLDDKGRCYIDKITPDGYYVDATGAWDGNPAA